MAERQDADPPAEVALLAEGGDRNIMFRRPRSMPILSPSSRRAGIEILGDVEGEHHAASPSSRRAGIEMRSWPTLCGKSPVALLAEGGDRNSRSEVTLHD